VARNRAGRRLRPTREAGIALPMALLVLLVLTIAGVSAAYFSGANSQNAELSKVRGSAYALAEAGVAEAMAVLSLPTNNALSPDLLGERTAAYADGTVTWSGTLDPTNATWTITSTGTTRNPTGPDAADVRRTIKAEVLVTASFTQPANNPVWNYIYAKRTGDPDGCDMEIRNGAEIVAPIYTEGNLCIGQTAKLVGSPVVVKGYLMLENPQNSVGKSNQPIAEAHIANGCQYKNQPFYDPCRGAPDNVFATTLDSTPVPIEPPEVDWDAWYANANPGPAFPCQVVSGTPPTFDNDGLRNASVPGVFHLTPGTSYSCKTAGGELSWDATARVLTTKGTIYIDGSAKIENGQVNQYNGQATIYLSGTLLIKNSKLCAGISGDTCDTSTWDPNSELLIFVADGNGDGVPVGDSTQTGSGNSIQLVSAEFQGGLMGTHTVAFGTTSTSDGPLLGDTIIVGQTVNNTFPFITILPAGAPGIPVVYAYPNPPKIYG
jgi:uncharacterized protein (UPF0333 family)